MSVFIGEYGAPTINAEWRLDVRATPGSGSWVQVRAITNFQPLNTPEVTDSGTYDSGYYGSRAVSAVQAQLTLTLQRNITGGAYDVGQEIIRNAADPNPSPDIIEARWYQPNLAAGLSFSASVMPTWEPEGGAKTAWQSVSVQLLGQGVVTSIAMPTPSAAAVITDALKVADLTSISATNTLPTAGGTQILVRGALLTALSGAAAVTVGGVNATAYAMLGSQQLLVTVPARSAGTHNLIVTNGSTVASAARVLHYA